MLPIPIKEHTLEPKKPSIKKPRPHVSKVPPEAFSARAVANQSDVYNLNYNIENPDFKAGLYTSPGLVVHQRKIQSKPQKMFSSRDRVIPTNSLLTQKPLNLYNAPFAPFDVVRRQTREKETQAISFEDHPLTYFSKHKNGDGHQFIYMKQVYPLMDPWYNPYLLEKNDPF
jgi:hypothetical protein